MKIELDISDDDIKRALIEGIVSWEIKDQAREELRSTKLKALVKEVVKEYIEGALRTMDLSDLQAEAQASLETQLKAAVKNAQLEALVKSFDRGG